MKGLKFAHRTEKDRNAIFLPNACVAPADLEPVSIQGSVVLETGSKVAAKVSLLMALEDVAEDGIIVVATPEPSKLKYLLPDAGEVNEESELREGFEIMAKGLFPGEGVPLIVPNYKVEEFDDDLLTSLLLTCASGDLMFIRKQYEATELKIGEHEGMWVKGASKRPDYDDLLIHGKGFSYGHVHCRRVMKVPRTINLWKDPESWGRRMDLILAVNNAGIFLSMFPTAVQVTNRYVKSIQKKSGNSQKNLNPHNQFMFLLRDVEVQNGFVTQRYLDLLKGNHE